jgi:hypothetical protein
MPRFIITERAAAPARHKHYKCPDCGGVFRHRILSPDDGPPDRCALCQSWMNMEAPPEPVFVPEAPGIRENAYARSIDRVYRAEEAASIQRAKDAADILEVKESDMAHLKITNMRDPSEMREGDISAIAPTPPSLQSGGSYAGFQLLGGAVPNHAPGVGPAQAGDQARQMINQLHAERGAQVVAKGQMGSYRE